MKRYALHIALSLMTLPAFAQSFDWPQWQGPSRTAFSKETGLLKEWPKEGPALKWRANNIGGGYSAPAVAGGKVFFMSFKDKNEVVTALSEADGSVLWTQSLGAAPKAQSPGDQGPACTPSVDDGKLYVMGIAGDVTCLNIEDHKVLWTTSIAKEFGAKSPMWNFRQSPLIDGDQLIISPGAADAAVVALDKRTGKTIWKSAVPGNPGPAYASAIAFEIDGVKQYVCVLARVVVGVEAKSGKFLWKYDKLAADINCNTAVYADGLILVSTAYDVGAAGVKVTKNADGTFKAEEAWFTRNLQVHHGGLIVLDGVLYGANGGNSGGFFVALDVKTGKTLWDQKTLGRGKGLQKGSLAFADGMLYYYTEDTGEVLLIEPSAKELIVKGRFTQPDRSKANSWTHPVIANGKLILRDQENMFCYDIKGK